MSSVGISRFNNLKKVITHDWSLATILFFKIEDLPIIFLHNFEPFLKDLKKSEIPEPSRSELVLFLDLKYKSAQRNLKYITAVKLRLKSELRRSSDRNSPPSQQSPYFRLTILYIFGLSGVVPPKNLASRIPLSFAPLTKIGLLKMYENSKLFFKLLKCPVKAKKEFAILQIVVLKN